MTKQQRAKWLSDPDFFRKQGAKGGKKGGADSWAKLTPAQRKARATKASRAAAVARTKKAKARKKAEG